MKSIGGGEGIPLSAVGRRILLNGALDINKNPHLIISYLLKGH